MLAKVDHEAQQDYKVGLCVEMPVGVPDKREQLLIVFLDG